MSVVEDQEYRILIWNQQLRLLAYYLCGFLQPQGFQKVKAKSDDVFLVSVGFSLDEWILSVVRVDLLRWRGVDIAVEQHVVHAEDLTQDQRILRVGLDAACSITQQRLEDLFSLDFVFLAHPS